MRAALITIGVVLLIAIGVVAAAFFLIVRPIGEGLEDVGQGIGETFEDLEGSLGDLEGSLNDAFGCAAKVPFEPTYAPKGYSQDVHCGSGGEIGQPPNEQSGQALAYYDAPRGFIDVVRGEFAFAQSRKKVISVLGGRATLGDIHEGYSVLFRFQGRKWTLVGYTGPLPRSELERFAEGLRPRQ